MKMKKVYGFLIAFVFLNLSFVNTVFAAASYGERFYDVTGKIDEAAAWKLSDALDQVSSGDTSYHIDIVTDLEGYEISEYAKLFFEQYNYANEETAKGISFMIYLTEDETGLAYQDHAICYTGDDIKEIGDKAREINRGLQDYLNQNAWSGDLEADNALFSDFAYYFPTAVDLASVPEIEEVEETIDDTVLIGELLNVRVVDLASILSETELSALSERAKEIEEDYNCGIYILTVPDYRDFHYSSALTMSRDVYMDYELGVGEDKDGIILLLSMDDRDYSFQSYGEFANEAMTDYGITYVEENFLAEFKNDNWAAGFLKYLEGSEEILQAAKDGKPFRSTSTRSGLIQALLISYGIAFIVAMIAAYLVTNFLKKLMQAPGEAKEAKAYVNKGKASISIGQEAYTHTTVRRVKIQKSSSGGRSTRRRSGFRGSHGKF